ncbi:MAG: hypothetical protein F4060_10975 [Holophagales bacterium]|nr:hypothetical protein [Holophagales bacterium]MYG32023.1 hypothetical protein [Holophagales bacterium]MYI80447.1 hypothetical protein [Holophagales bacterium]
MRQFIRRHPFWTFYAAAVLIGLLAWIYLMTVEVVLQEERGPDYSAYGEFVGYRDATRAAHPTLHHHGDSALLYMQAAASKMPILLPMFSFPFAPTLAALLIVGIGWKRLGLRALIGLYRPIRGNLSLREGAQLYATLVGFLVTFVSSLLIVEQLFGRSYGGMIGPVGWAVAGLVVIALVGPDLGWQRRVKALGDDDPSLIWSGAAGEKGAHNG